MIRPRARGAHVRQDRLRHPDEAEDVDVEDALVLGDGALLGGAGCADAGVVDQDVDPPEPLDHVPDRRADRLVAGDVEVEERHTGERGDARRLPARADHLETGRDEGGRGRPPDARGRARHERYRLGCCCHRGLLALIG